MFFRNPEFVKGVFLWAVLVATCTVAGRSTSSDGMRAVVPYVRTYELGQNRLSTSARPPYSIDNSFSYQPRLIALFIHILWFPAER
eukprot:COSAG01_NODE_8682_length_2697_cov_23.461124_1_plen_86_part_00